MDYSSDTIANRDDAIPVLHPPSKSENPPPLPPRSKSPQRKRDILRDQAGKLKEKLEQHVPSEAQGQSLQDRLLNGLMAQIIPPEDLSDNDGNSNDSDQRGSAESQKDRRSRTYVSRPNFSIQTMSSNFRRFNARVGVVFVLQNRLIHLFTWRQPTATLSFLALYTLLTLNPHLLPLLPFLGLLFYILIPSFLARHPAPANDPRVEPASATLEGPPVAPPSRVRPAPEMSKDFFRNMRDLQNSMEDFSALHDLGNEWVTPYTNFSDEGVSSGLFLGVLGLAALALVGSEIVPWRVVGLVAGWGGVLAGHPGLQGVVGGSRSWIQLLIEGQNLLAKIGYLVENDIILDAPPEVRQVEVFELQKFHAYSGTWEPWLFSPSAYDPLSPARIGGARAKGTQFFDDVREPAGWVWKEKKWKLDLESREWVEERMIVGVDVEVEGGRWVYDFPVERVEEMAGAGAKEGGRKGVRPKSGWEEGDGMTGRGEWRRRRWVRLVERRGLRKEGGLR
ncbi:hypothetical protein LTR62_002730 [Meristemomyces frigidus]|uniref:TECPR1-like DysF domain-containing protein n=1 Tax=Meristemomyces frigidus TaxID=1508187 RepID=A0AAN7TQQ9_9PEZI|nr:hypothetical protein LTR62_002730 [Meristemomyces frigidus]